MKKLAIISLLLLLTACGQELPSKIGDEYYARMVLIDYCTYLVYDVRPSNTAPFKVYIGKEGCESTYNDAIASDHRKYHPDQQKIQ